uniref:Zinc finger protein-like 1 homolog n=1 Tax=Tabanus bromius TaxID=304241 RepID=A0A0K8TLZ4_TABBR
MGLCKCPKRQVTNQFCFEHRVNVCENCMVTNHPKCIVQSYLQWLKDSDYVSTCTLCGNNLENDECVRLICYHVFHWSCLNARQSALPVNTAPGGHTCPSCSEPIFPPSNLISPVADVLRSRLGQVNWGRNELGLPLLSNESSPEKMLSYASQTVAKASASNKVNGTFYNNTPNNSNQVASTHSVVVMDSFSPPSSDLHASSRRQLSSKPNQIGGLDRDDNKYKRRTPAEIFSRWSRRLYAPSSRPPWRRTWFMVLVGFLIFALIIILMFNFGRRSISNDDDWDINNNPNLNFRDDE